ncbi:MAG TPA: response regulator transcription factor [Gemmatimonadales bacterium]
MPSSHVAPAQVHKHRVFVVDDHPIVRQGLALLIDQQPDLVVCGAAEEAESALAAIAASRPDVLVLDISLPGRDGIELLKAIRASNSELPILVLSMHDETMYAERALRAGANGYIMKQEATENVLVALRRILRQEVYLSDRIASRMLRQLASHGREANEAPISRLSDRELEVFRLIGTGLSTRQIADELRLSVKTVESYQAHIKDKLALHSSRDLVQRAIEWRMGRRNE